MAAITNPDSRPLPPGWAAHHDSTKQRWYYVQLSSPPRVVFEHPADLDLPPGIDDVPATSPQFTGRRPLPQPGKQTLMQPVPHNQTFAPAVNQASSLPTPPSSAAEINGSASVSPAPSSPASVRHNQASPSPSRPMSTISQIPSATSRPISSVGQSPVSPTFPTSASGQNSGGFSRPTSVISQYGARAPPVNRPPPSTLTAAQRLYNSAGTVTAGPLVTLDNITTLSTAPAGDMLLHTTRSSHNVMSSVAQLTPQRNGPQAGHQHMDRTQSLRTSVHIQQGATSQHLGRSQTYSIGPGMTSIGGTAAVNTLTLSHPTGVQQLPPQARPANQHLVQSTINTGVPRPPQNVMTVMRPPTGSQLQPIPAPSYTAVQAPLGQPGSPPAPLSPISLSGSSAGSFSPPPTSVLFSSPGSTSSGPTASLVNSSSMNTSPVIPPSLSYHPAPASSAPPTFSSIYQQPNNAQQSAVTISGQSNNTGRLAAQFLAKTTGAVVSSVVAATTGVQVGRLVNALTSPAVINKLWQSMPSSSKTGTGIGQADLQAALEGKPNAKYAAVIAALKKQQQVHQQQIAQYQQLVAQVQMQIQAGIPVHQMPIPPQDPPIDYATVIAEVQKLQAAAVQQVKIQQQLAAQQQAHAQQQALAQKISYAQAAHHGLAQPLLQQQAHLVQAHPQNLQHQQPHLHVSSIQHAQQIHSQQAHPQQHQHQQLQHHQQPQHHQHQQLQHHQQPQQHQQQQQHQYQQQQQQQQPLQQQMSQQPHQQQHPQQHLQQAASQATQQQHVLQQQPTYHQQGMHPQNQQPTSPHHQHANHSHQVNPQVQQQQPWQPTAANVNQVNPQIQTLPQQPWQANTAAPSYSLPQQYQQAFTTPPQQHHHPQQSQHQHQQAQHQQQHDSSDNNPLDNFMHSLTDGINQNQQSQNQQSQNQVPSYSDSNSNFYDSSLYDPNNQNSLAVDPSTDPSSSDAATQFYNMVSQTLNPNSSGDGSSNFSGMMNNITQNLQAPQLPNFNMSSDVTANVLNNLTQPFQQGNLPLFGDPNSGATAGILNSLAQNLQSNPVTSSFGDNGGLAGGLFNTLVGNSTDTGGGGIGGGGSFDLSGLASGLGQAMSGLNTDSINLDVDVNLNFGN